MYGIEYFTTNIYNIIALIFAFVILTVGSITDLKKREVADFVNYGLFFGAIGLRLLYSIYQWDYMVLVEGLIGFFIAFTIGIVLFYTGQWGGGDSKMIIGLGVLFGLPMNINVYVLLSSLFFAFLINSFVMGSFYGIAWSIYLAMKNKSKFLKEWKKNYNSKPLKFFEIFMICICIFLVVYAHFGGALIYLLLIPSLLILSIVYLFAFSKSVEKCQMLKEMRVEEKPKSKLLKNLIMLTEGEWIAKDVKYKGKYICGPKDLGISKEQIEELKKLGIKKVLVKVGIPFVPSFWLGFIFTFFFGNLLVLILTKIL